MGDGESRGDRIVDVAIRMAMSGNIPMSTSDGSGEPCVIDCNADGLFLAFGKERWNVSKEDLRSLWRRFKEWTVRPDQAADFAPFFEDLNRWGVDGDRVIRKTAALLLFAMGLVKDAERMRSEDFWGRLQAEVPLRRHFVGKGGRPSYWRMSLSLRAMRRPLPFSELMWDLFQANLSNAEFQKGFQYRDAPREHDGFSRSPRVPLALLALCPRSTADWQSMTQSSGCFFWAASTGWKN